MASPCGYPDSVRDGLHPYQYFALAKVYLGDFNLDKAKLCIEKMRVNKPLTVENARLIWVLENCYMPINPVPASALKQLNRAMEIVKTERNSRELQELRRELVSKFPNFEWPYFLVDSDSSDQNEGLKKILSINPNNVEALARLVNEHSKNSEAELALRYEYARKAAELDPSREDIQFERPVKIVRSVSPEHLRRVKEIEKLQREKKFVERTYKFIDTSGKNAFYVGPNVSTAKTFSDGLLSVEVTHGSYQYWNKTGDLAFDINASNVRNASEGLCAVRPERYPDGSRWGFVDYKGKNVISPVYLDAMPFQEGMAAVEVCVGMENHLSSKAMWGFINPQGELLIEPIYDHCFPFVQGLAAVVINGKVGFINKDGKFAIPPKYDCARMFSEGLSNVILTDQKNERLFDQYIKPDGSVAFSTEYRFAKGKKLSEVISTHEYLYPKQHEFQNLEKLEYRRPDFHEGLVVRSRETAPNVWKMGFVDKSDDFKISPKFDSAEAFSDGRARVIISEKYGFVNSKGELVIPAKYKSARDFSNGMAAVSCDGENWGYIDTSGKSVTDEIYLEAYSFSGGLAKVGVPQ